MTLTRNDLVATGFTVLVVLTYFATYEGWGVWLVGGSHRWATGAILILGVATCGRGSMASGAVTKALSVLGALALMLAVLALATGSLTALSALVIDDVALWAVSTMRHVARSPETPVPSDAARWRSRVLWRPLRLGRLFSRKSRDLYAS